MEYNFAESTIKEFVSLKPGDVFSSNNILFMKIQPIMDDEGEIYNAVNLETGKLESLSWSMEVVFYKYVLIVK